MAEQDRNQLPSSPPPSDPAQLRAWLEQFWRAAKELQDTADDHEERIADLEAAP